jgi:hypothetical protein
MYRRRGLERKTTNGRRTANNAVLSGTIGKMLVVPHQQEKSGSRRLPLSIEQILVWADAHHKSTGKWPNINSGPVMGAAGENWSAISAALTVGCRGLPHGSSAARRHSSVRRTAIYG